MRLQVVPPASSIYPARGSAPNTLLHGRRLIIARAAWILLALLTVGTFVVGLPLAYASIHTLCPAAPCTTFRLTPSEAREATAVGLSLDRYVAAIGAVLIVQAVVWCAVGAVIVWRKSDDWMALFIALFLVLFGAQVPTEQLSPFTPLWWVATILADSAWVALTTFFFVFPDGRFVPRWTWIWVVLVILGQIPESLPVTSPFHVNNWPPLLMALMLLTQWGSAIYAQIYRYHWVSGPIERQQTKWVVFGGATAFGVGVIFNVLSVLFPTLIQPHALYNIIGETVFTASLLLIPLSLGIAVLRYRLWDIDPIINRTLVYGALTTSIVGIYVLVVGYLGAVFRTESNLVISLVATGIVAVLFQPLRERLQRSINRLMYGERDDPYAVISRLGQRLEATLAPEAVLPTIVQTVKEALKLPYAAIALKQDDEYRIVAENGQPQGSPLPDDLVRLPLVYQHETVGQLLLNLRAAGEPFTPADRRLLDDLARQAGVAAHAVRLTVDLQRSRERLVTAREEERRRLRRDLHDGLGPCLAALNLQAGVLRKLISRDPAAADDLVVELRSEIRAAIADIRRLVYELRPPTLDELGLVAAIRDYAAQCSSGGRLAVEPDSARTGDLGLQVVVDAPEQLPPLPAAVEVAVYRIVQEALVNVVRHAQARSCVVRLILADALHVEIADDGVGLLATRKPGVGLLSMRERAAELGGTCMIETIPTGGTRVLARLPLP